MTRLTALRAICPAPVSSSGPVAPNETPVTRAFRDGRLASIGGGADEIMLSIICKYMGTLPGKSNRK